MKLTDLFEIEKSRNIENANKIYLNKEGLFYRVYNWSAWLLKGFVCTEAFQKERGDEKVLSAMCYQAKDNNSYIMCGFPITSLSKYIPVYDKTEVLEDGSMVIIIENPFAETSLENIKASYEQWKSSCPIKEKSRVQKAFSGDGNASNMGRSGILSIVSIVLSYPVESSTPAQNIEFISKLKQRVASLL